MLLNSFLELRRNTLGLISKAGPRSSLRRIRGFIKVSIRKYH